MKEYEQLILKYSIDYDEINHSNIDETVFNDFFISYSIKKFFHHQVFNFEGLKGRLLFSSYIPNESHFSYNSMVKDLKNIFSTNQKEGKVEFIYQTEIYYGKL